MRGLGKLRFDRYLHQIFHISEAEDMNMNEKIDAVQVVINEIDRTGYSRGLAAGKKIGRKK